MASNLATVPEPDPLRAVSVSRDVQEFDLLIEDMEAELGEGWGDLDFAEAAAFLRQDEAQSLEFIVVAVDQEDEPRLSLILDVISLAKRAGLKVILVADGLGPMALHELMRAGADDFAPYPLPENALSEAVARVRDPEPVETGDAIIRAGTDVVDATVVTPNLPTTGGGKSADATIFAVQSASGGDGATTVAVNLAWELANIDKEKAPKVCLIDMGLQFGSVATYLDLQRAGTVFQVLTDITNMDEQGFMQSLTPYREKIHVFTAPSDVLPLDVIGPEEMEGLLKLAKSCFDIVIIDMPAAVTAWTETVLEMSDIYFVTCGLEVRSAQNALRFQRLLQGEGLPTEKLGFLLNRAPGKMDMSGKSRIDKMADSLDVKFHAVFPDGGKQVTEVNDQAAPLSEMAPRNALTKEVHKLAKDLYDARQRFENGEVAEKPAKKKGFLGLKFG